MSDIIIQADGLGKSYRIAHSAPRKSYTALRDVLSRQAHSLWNRARGALRGKPTTTCEPTEEFWALRDITFNVKRGEAVGIIGRNGAGKSTLLKILSRITEPTEGRARLSGRVASLLEVGTGFHPELTGRENIYLNGAILGMTRAEIRHKFDEIVAFADVERFLDTPVKRYSSGMYVRLAFSIAAHLESEILIVDEVLAVGDAVFQKKCLGRMNTVTKSGRTVLFVSHNMGMIQRLCERTVILEKGNVRHVGPSESAIPIYLAAVDRGANYQRPLESSCEIAVRSAAVQLKETDDETMLALTVEVIASREQRVNIDLRITDVAGTAVAFGGIGTFNHAHEVMLRPGLTRIQSLHDVSILATGAYSISIDVGDTRYEYLDCVHHCLAFDINPPPRNGCYRRMIQKWGFGSIELPYKEHTISYLDLSEVAGA